MSVDSYYSYIYTPRQSGLKRITFSSSLMALECIHFSKTFFKNLFYRFCIPTENLRQNWKKQAISENLCPPPLLIISIMGHFNEKENVNKMYLEKNCKVWKELETVGGVAHTRYPLSIHFDSINAWKMAKFNLRKKWYKMILRIISKPHAYLQTTLRKHVRAIYCNISRL